MFCLILNPTLSYPDLGSSGTLQALSGVWEADLFQMIRNGEDMLFEGRSTFKRKRTERDCCLHVRLLSQTHKSFWPPISGRRLKREPRRIKLITLFHLKGSIKIRNKSFFSLLLFGPSRNTCLRSIALSISCSQGKDTNDPLAPPVLLGIKILSYSWPWLVLSSPHCIH